MTLNEFKVIFWWEFIHRLLGRLIGIFFLLPMIFFSIKLGLKKTFNLYFIFILICFQGFIGWYMVSSGLVDRIDVSHYRLSIHLFTAFIILSLILWNYLSYKKANKSEKKINAAKLENMIYLINISLLYSTIYNLHNFNFYSRWE